MKARLQVGRGGRPGREPTSLLRGKGLECGLDFKRCARGRCFRCHARDHHVSTCRGPFRCIRYRRHRSVFVVLDFLPLLVKRWSLLFDLRSLLLLSNGATLHLLNIVALHHPEVGLRSWATRLQRWCQHHLLRVACSSRSTPLWTLSLSVPCCLDAHEAPSAS
jgi:hypothetical protein